MMAHLNSFQTKSNQRGNKKGHKLQKNIQNILDECVCVEGREGIHFFLIIIIIITTIRVK